MDDDFRAKVCFFPPLGAGFANFFEAYWYTVRKLFAKGWSGAKCMSANFEAFLYALSASALRFRYSNSVPRLCSAIAMTAYRSWKLSRDSCASCFSSNSSYSSIIALIECSIASLCLLSWDSTAHILRWVSAGFSTYSSFSSMANVFYKY